MKRPVPAEHAANPWVSVDETFGYSGITCDCESRIYQIRRSNDVAWLERVLRWTDSQVTVRAAAMRRLRALHRMHYLKL